jgi:hypothetical protein
MTVRNFECQVFGGPCADTRCKRDFCAREQDETKKQPQGRAPRPQETVHVSLKARETIRKIVEKMPRMATKPRR